MVVGVMPHLTWSSTVVWSLFSSGKGGLERILLKPV